MSLKKLLCSAAMGLFFAAAAHESVAASPALLQVRIASNAIVAEGVSQKGEVILIGVSHEHAEYRDVVRPWLRVETDDDSDGRVTFALDAAISPASMWIVADIRSGNYGVATPDGFKLLEIALPASTFRRGESGDVAAVELLRASALVVVVRQGAGAWRMHADQDGPNDEQGADPLVMRISPAALKPLGGNAPPPRVLTPGDLLLVVDPFKLDFSVARVTK